MNVNEFLSRTRIVADIAASIGREFLETRIRIICADGFSLSVQASDLTYATPRDNDGPYTAVEVGFPSARPPETWKEYCDDEWQELGIVGYVKRLWKNRSQIMFNISYGFTHGSFWLLKHYLQRRDNATTSVYGYIPVELVDKLISDHGGIDVGKMEKHISLLKHANMPKEYATAIKMIEALKR